jgi:hypothetical protein
MFFQLLLEILYVFLLCNQQIHTACRSCSSYMPNSLKSIVFVLLDSLMKVVRKICITSTFQICLCQISQKEFLKFYMILKWIYLIVIVFFIFFFLQKNLWKIIYTFIHCNICNFLSKNVFESEVNKHHLRLQYESTISETPLICYWYQWTF